MLPAHVHAYCERLLGSNIRKITAVGGGDISEARLLQTDTALYFIKINRSPAALQMFQTEAAGLRLIRDTAAIRSPAVIHCECIRDDCFLLMEYIESGPRTTAFWERFGTSLAVMHQEVQPHYGLHFDNYIGSLRQFNPTLADWPAFYHQARLQPQLELARKDRKMNPDDLQRFERLFQKLPELLPDEHPSLIHGDLWSGNFLAAQTEEVVLIDPAVCFAHREMDLAMSRLFGGFSPLFYAAYENAYPLLPGWQERVPLYQLYYLLVHVNLFGGGYLQSVRQILQRFA